MIKSAARGCRVRMSGVARGPKCTALVAILAGFASMTAGCSSRPRHSVSLREVPEGVSAHKLDGKPVFVVRRGASVVAFLADVRHLPGERGLWWCPKEQQFVSPTHGELFDRDGHVLGGPARGDLNRLQITVRNGRVVSLGG